MSQYLVLFRNRSAADGYLLSPEDMARDMPAWQLWIGEMALRGKLVATQPIGWEGVVISREGTRAGPDLDADSVVVAGYLICEATDLAEVRRWGMRCPILMYPHGRVEIRPILPFSIL